MSTKLWMASRQRNRAENWQFIDRTALFLFICCKYSCNENSSSIFIFSSSKSPMKMDLFWLQMREANNSLYHGTIPTHFQQQKTQLKLSQLRKGRYQRLIILGPVRLEVLMRRGAFWKGQHPLVAVKTLPVSQKLVFDSQNSYLIFLEIFLIVFFYASSNHENTLLPFLQEKGPILVSICKLNWNLEKNES